MIKLKNTTEIELMRQSALLVSKTLTEVAKILKPGIPQNISINILPVLLPVMGRCLPF